MALYKFRIINIIIIITIIQKWLTFYWATLVFA